MDRVCIWIVSRNFENCEEEERERERKKEINFTDFSILLSNKRYYVHVDWYRFV